MRGTPVTVIGTMLVGLFALVWLRQTVTTFLKV
jgi:hypothetical protein